MRISKKTWLTLLGFLVSGVFLFIFIQNDAFLYQRPLGKVTAVKTESTEKTTDVYNNTDQMTRQKLTFEILNSKYKGRKLQVTNTYSNSSALDQKYRVGQQVFLDIHERKGELDASIADYKRDIYLFMLSFLVIFLLYLTMQFQGIKTLLSVMLNFVLFLLAVELDVRLNLTNFFWIFVVFAVIFTALSLTLVIGLNRQCLITFSAIILSTTLALVIGCVTLYLTKSQGIHYEALDYATQSPKQLFLAATVIGSLGAVMDAATDIVATLFEMKKSQPKTSKKQLFLSGRAVGRSIMGPLINVLLLIFFAETIALSVVYFKTGNSIAYTFEWTMALGVVQALISGIGIVLTIPVASFLSAYSLSLGGKEHVSD
ncbi:YibE/F family protein [Ligilactobacillus faecis]|uniref:YibE/F family protein n=1 Tax=Ligilactobacillus faecis TaxID=762833 RepID=A0ABV4DTU5_9LACO